MERGGRDDGADLAGIRARRDGDGDGDSPLSSLPRRDGDTAIRRNERETRTAERER